MVILQRHTLLRLSISFSKAKYSFKKDKSTLNTEKEQRALLTKNEISLLLGLTSNQDHMGINETILGDQIQG